MNAIAALLILSTIFALGLVVSVSERIRAGARAQVAEMEVARLTSETNAVKLDAVRLTSELSAACADSERWKAYSEEWKRFYFDVRRQRDEISDRFTRHLIGRVTAAVGRAEEEDEPMTVAQADAIAVAELRRLQEKQRTAGGALEEGRVPRAVADADTEPAPEPITTEDEEPEGESLVS